jgi:hypothetical protein
MNTPYSLALTIGPRSSENAISDFIPMSESVQGHVPKVTVPRSIERAFARAIAERKRVSSWFRSVHESDEDTDSDDRHLFFVGVLEKAFMILCPPDEVLRKTTTVSERRAPEPASLVLQNAFAGLEIEDVNTTTGQTGSDP